MSSLHSARRGGSTGGAQTPQSSHGLVCRLFIRLLALVYLIAFLSLIVQVNGLIGSKGILPVAELLDWVRQAAGARRFWLLPTLCWLDPRDGFLVFLCVGGAGAAALLLLGVAPAAALFVLWAFYLSLAVAGQIFMDYQWDALLLETGFLAIFLAPPALRPRSWEPSRLVLWLMRWLLFRLMFSSGVVKLLSGDATWRGLTALRYHYSTQPLPTWIGWYAQHLPDWFQTLSCALMFAVELGAPLLIFAPRRFRFAGCAVLVAFQLLIAATGNYCFFNLLTIALCLLLLDDRALSWRPWVVAAEAAGAEAPPAATSGHVWPRVVVYPVAALVLFVSGGVFASTLGLLGRWPAPLAVVYGAVAPLRIVSGYGLFAVMTTSRPEIVVEGSQDGLEWRAYEFPYKPGDLRRPPGFVAPHQPRLDWQMWFAALGTCSDNPWFVRLLLRLQQGSPPVLHLLRTNPFPGAPPQWIRAVVYDYRFTDLETLRGEGAWWRRRPVGPYCPELVGGAQAASGGAAQRVLAMR